MEQGIVATVFDPTVSMLVFIDADEPGTEGDPWTPELQSLKSERWTRAKNSQALKDAEAIAALRNSAVDLLDAAERCAALERFVRDVIYQLDTGGFEHTADEFRKRPEVVAALQAQNPEEK